MANKHQVLSRLALGMSPAEIANELGCLPAYVRAVRAREFGNGAQTEQRYSKSDKGKAVRRAADKNKRERIYSTPDGREAFNKHKRMIRNGNSFVALFPRAGVHYPSSR